MSTARLETFSDGVFAIAGQIGRVDRTFLVLSVLFLMLVAFIPFPTRLVGAHLRGGEGAQAAALAYGITLTTTAILYNALWLYASRGRRLLSREAAPGS